MQATPAARTVAPAARATDVAMAENAAGWKAAGLAAALALSAGVQSASAGPFTRSEIASLTYEQIKGTGLANTCPKVEKGGADTIKVTGGKKYKIEEFCLEPTSFQVLEEKLTKQGLVTEAVDTKVTTRQTYVLTGIDGDLISDGGKLAFVEQDGIDYAATSACRSSSRSRTWSPRPTPRPARSPPAPSSPAASRCPRTAPASSSTRRAAAPRPATIRPSRCRRCRRVATRRCSRRTTRSSRCSMARSSSRSPTSTASSARLAASSCTSSPPTLTLAPRCRRSCCSRAPGSPP